MPGLQVAPTSTESIYHTQEHHRIDDDAVCSRIFFSPDKMLDFKMQCLCRVPAPSTALVTRRLAQPKRCPFRRVANARERL